LPIGAYGKIGGERVKIEWLIFYELKLRFGAMSGIARATNGARFRGGWLSVFKCTKLISEEFLGSMKKFSGL
jgi:hypothetical protein